MPNPEFFKKLAQSITHELSRLTEEGYFYRVDLRLRPEGSSGSVASSLTACKNYYASWGETFERLALIKARPVAGSTELGDEFCQAMDSFVYRKFLDFAALEEIQEIKDRINSKLGSKQESHVKLGRGGIREIEFFVQALQLIYGGRFRDLRGGNTLVALEKLRKHRFLTAQDHRQLREAYLFLRDLEHKLQMVFDFQTHELPPDNEELYRCARRMGFVGESALKTLNQFSNAYREHTMHVSQVFQKLIGLKHVGPSESQSLQTALVLNRNLREEEALRLLSEYGFEDLRTAFHQIVLLRDAPSFAHSPSRTRNLLANLLPSLLERLKASPDADAGLAYFEKFVGSLGEREALYTLLNESPAALVRLVRVLSCGPLLAEFLCRRPEFFDFVVRQESGQNAKRLGRAEPQLRLEGKGDRQASQSALRSFQQTQRFRVGVNDILGRITRPQVGKQLADLAGTCLKAAVEVALQEMKALFGNPFVHWLQEHFAIVALGKLGGGDLSYDSDLDLICFYWVDDPKDSAEVQPRLVRFIEAIDEILSISRGEGSIYKIDLRLRPDGKKGELVVALHKYQDYLASRAQNWERLALVRQRFLLGSANIRSQLKRVIEDFVYRPELDAATVRELVHIRHRMETELAREQQEQRFHLKAGAGGLVDIEFATQLLQMRYGRQIPELRIANTLVALKRLHRFAFIRSDQYEALHQGYEFLRVVENRLRIALGGAASLPRHPKNLRHISRLLGEKALKQYMGNEDFESGYLRITRRVRTVFEEISADLARTA